MTVLVGRGPRGETFCRKAPRKGPKLADLDRYLAALHGRYDNLVARHDQEPACSML